MKKIALAPLVLVAALALLSTGADANAMDNVVITGTYDSSASSTMFSGPDDTFTLSFSLPAALGAGVTDTGIPITIGFGGSTTTLASPANMIRFFSSGIGGGLVVDVHSPTALFAFEWDLTGPQLFNSSNDLLLGNFTIAPSDGFFPQLIDLTSTGVTAAITGGTISISPATTGVTPEPSSLVLLGTGLLGLGPLIRRRFSRA